MPNQRTLVWLRRDLRLHDHAALCEAASLGEIVCVFVFDTEILGALADKDDRRVSFIWSSIQSLQDSLREHGSMLLLRCGNPVDQIPELAKSLGVSTVVCARDFEPYARERDAAVTQKLGEHGIQLRSVLDSVVIEPERVIPASSPYYSVYTPYMKAWKIALASNDVTERSIEGARFVSESELAPFVEPWNLERVGFTWNPPNILLGEEGGQRQLAQFIESGLTHYHERRDFPEPGTTSDISPHLRFGTVSIRECVRLCQSHLGPGSEKWLNELIWREFYQQVLWHRPDAAFQSFRPEYRDVAWPGRPEHLKAWKAGKTGYPIVDAAMRCIAATGTMHNRLRMVVASFLVKDLLLDWRLGEAHFARLLLDFELASNNGGWQWAASTGCDAQPYFRIFNPWLQSVKSDPQGNFIRKWCPELAGFDSVHIHNPSEASIFDQTAAGCRVGQEYPEPIVVHAVQKEAFTQLFQDAQNRFKLSQSSVE